MRPSRRGPRRPRQTAPKTLPWRNLQNPLPPVEVLSADQIEAIHRASLKVLAEEGLRVLDGGARDFLAAAGAAVEPDTQMVRFDPAPATPPRASRLAAIISISEPSAGPRSSPIWTRGGAPARSPK